MKIVAGVAFVWAGLIVLALIFGRERAKFIERLEFEEEWDRIVRRNGLDDL